MDKKLWLRVIREELELLDKLATGMIEDDHLSKEEIVLAVSRSKIIANEFEMLLNYLPAPLGTEKRETAKMVQTETKFQPPVSSQIPPVYAVKEETASPVAKKLTDLTVDQVPAQDAAKTTTPSNPEDSELILLDFEPEVKLSHANSKFEAQPVQSKPVTYDLGAEPIRPNRGIPATESEEHTLLNQELRNEEYSRFKLSPIRSLKEGLVLNDRYLFQKELFNNDKSRLDEAIDALDRLDNILEAVDYLKANFRWTKNEASEKFVQLVKRRFSEHKG